MTAPSFATFEEEGEQKLEQLRQRILILTEAAPNVRRSTLEELESLLPGLPEADVAIVAPLLPRLKPPETLVGQRETEDLSFRDAFLTEARPSATHPALVPLNTLIQDLEHAALALPTLSSLRDLRQVYQGFHTRVRDVSPQERIKLLEPRVELSGTGLGHYLITQEMARALLSIDDTGGLQFQNQQGTSPVTSSTNPDNTQGVSTWGVHFKADGRKTNPSLPALKPALEASVFWFYQLLTGQGIVPSCVLALNNVLIKRPTLPLPEGAQRYLRESKSRSLREYFRKYPDPLFEQKLESTFERRAEDYVFQASETILGEDFEQWVKAHGHDMQAMQTLEQTSLSSHFMTSLLVNLGDAKADNYRLNAQRELIGIDNDHVFVDELRHSGRSADEAREHYMGIRCLFYGWHHLLEAPLAPLVRQRLSISPVTFLATWLKKLSSLDAEYSRLRSQGYLSDFWWTPHVIPEVVDVQDETGTWRQTCHEKTHPPLFPTLLPQNLMRHLVTKLDKLQRLLGDPAIQTHDQALRFMHPFVEAYYRHVRLKAGHDLWRTLGYIYEPPLSIEEELRQGGESIKTLFSVRDPIPLTYATHPQTIRDLARALAGQCDCTSPLTSQHVKRVESLLPLLGTIRLTDLSESWAREDLLGALIAQGLSTDAICWFIQAGAPVNGRDAQGRTPLHHAVLYGQIDLPWSHTQLTTLLQQGAQAEVLDGRRVTPLSLALAQGDGESVIHLIHAGATHASASPLTDFFVNQIQGKPISRLSEAFARLLSRNSTLAWHLTLETLLPKAGTGLHLMTASFGERTLFPGLSTQLLDTTGKMKRQAVYGRRDVACVKREESGIALGLYFKKYPELPGLEEAVGRLTRKLIGHGAPFVDLANLKGEPVLISQAVTGESLQDVLKKTPDKNPEQLHHLDPQSLSEMLLVAMLVNPEDGKPDNYILQPLAEDPTRFRLVGIDNDHAFVPAVAREQKQGLFQKHEVVQVKSVLYCLNQMKHKVHPRVRKHFIATDPSAVLKEWLIELKDVNDRFNMLFTRDQGDTFFSNRDCFLGIPLKDTMIPHLYQKMLRMQQMLEENEAITHLDLLIQLEPQLGKRYQLALDKPCSVLQRFEDVDGIFYSKAIAGHHLTKINSHHILQSMDILSKKSILQEIRDGKAYSPHVGLQQLEKLTKQQTEAIITRAITQNLGITQALSELLLPEKQETLLAQLDFKTMSVQGQQGIIRWLQGQPDMMNQWRMMSFKYSSVLTGTDLVTIEMGNLRSLDLRGCSRLPDTILTLLAQKCRGLEKLNLSENKSFQEMHPGFLGTTPLFQNLKTLHLSQCTRLQAVECTVPQLTVLELQGCPALTTLHIKAPQLQKLDLREDKNVTDAMLATVVTTTPHLTTLHLEGCDMLTENGPAIYGRFLKGVLIYRPKKGSDEGRVNLPIAALSNPLEGTFDLSACGDTGQYVSINTGYRKGKKAENANKVEIWFTPRFLVERDLGTTAKHFQQIFPKQWPERAPVGIIWTWGNDDNMAWYDYLANQNMDELGNENLYKKWWRAEQAGAGIEPAGVRAGVRLMFRM